MLRRIVNRTEDWNERYGTLVSIAGWMSLAVVSASYAGFIKLPVLVQAPKCLPAKCGNSATVEVGVSLLQCAQRGAESP